MLDPKGHPQEAERAFMFRLARDLGMTVKELERRLTAREFAEWAAFYTAEAKVQEMEERKAANQAKKARARRRPR